MKKALIAFLVVLSIPVIFVTIVSLPWLLMLVCSVFEPNPPVPQITSGEFPFCLEYRIGDETFIVEDVIVCEYDGIKWNEGSGKHRTWKKSLKNSGQESLLILTDGDIEIFCNVGKAEYYMDDLSYPVNEAHTPNFYHVSSQLFLNTKELLDKYDIELINYQLSDPIENSFKESLYQRILNFFTFASP